MGSRGNALAAESRGVSAHIRVNLSSNALQASFLAIELHPSIRGESKFCSGEARVLVRGNLSRGIVEEKQSRRNPYAERLSA
jgi:hypothetical protein